MALSKQHKVLGVVAALGIGAVGVDRLVLSSPGTGPASADAAVSAAALMPGVDAAPKTPAAAPEAPDPAVQRFTGHAELADRLGTLADAKALDLDEAFDAFTPRGDFGRVKPKASQSAAGPPFEQRHRLEATFAVDGQWVAVVGGTTLRVGSVYDGYTLAGVRQGEATFERDGVQVTLKLLPG